jgi:hypothetical protein
MTTRLLAHPIAPSSHVTRGNNAHLTHLPCHRDQAVARHWTAFCRALADEEAADPSLRDALLQLIRGGDLDHNHGT